MARRQIVLLHLNRRNAQALTDLSYSFDNLFAARIARLRTHNIAALLAQHLDIGLRAQLGRVRNRDRIELRLARVWVHFLVRLIIDEQTDRADDQHHEPSAA